MSQCVERIAHSCGSSDGLQVFLQDDGSYNGRCFVCNTHVPDPYEDKEAGYTPPPKFTKSPEQIAQEMDSIKECKTFALPDRKLKLEYLKEFGIKVGVSTSDGVTPDILFFPYTDRNKLTAYKNKVIATKQMWSTGTTRDADMFNWYKAMRSGAKRLYITEGELDAVAVTQAIREKQKGTDFADQPLAVVSLSNGSSSVTKNLSKHLQTISRLFKEVVLVFDMDEAGRKAVADAMKVMPNALSVDLPEKDANDCIMKGRTKALANALLFQSAKPKNSRIVWGTELVTAAREEAEMGVSYPWATLTEQTRGIRKGETIYIGAGVKMGKSEVVNALADHLIRTHGWKVFMAKPEEANVKTMKLLVGKAAGKIFHDPNIPFDYKAYDKAAPKIASKVCMVNLYQHLGWETLKADIIYAASQGCEAIIIDPITALMPENASDANSELVRITKELSAMAMDLDIVVFIFCHLKAPTSGDSHERGGKVYSTQFAGSRAMMRQCNYMIGMEGNKDPELSIEERNFRDLVLLEDREFGVTGKTHLYWDLNTGLFNEVHE